MARYKINEMTGLAEVIVETMAEVDMRNLTIPIIGIYREPADHPDKYVARIFDADRPTPIIMLSDNLEELKKDIEQTGMVFLLRGKEDVPELIGAYM